MKKTVLLLAALTLSLTLAQTDASPIGANARPIGNVGSPTPQFVIEARREAMQTYTSTVPNTNRTTSTPQTSAGATFTSSRTVSQRMTPQPPRYTPSGVLQVSVRQHQGIEDMGQAFLEVFGEVTACSTGVCGWVPAADLVLLQDQWVAYEVTQGVESLEADAFFRETLGSRVRVGMVQGRTVALAIGGHNGRDYLVRFLVD